MNGIINTALSVFTVLLALVGLFFLIRAVQSRLSVTDRSYGVARQEARVAMLLNVARTAFFLILALIAFAVLNLIPSEEPADTTVEPRPTLIVEPSGTAPVDPTARATQTQPTPTFTLMVPSRTPFPTDTPEPTSTPVLPSAIVVSPNGLWLREAPGGTQEIELIPDGAVLILLPGVETADELEWQEVRSSAGNEGWVAVEFIEYQQ